MRIWVTRAEPGAAATAARLAALGHEPVAAPVLKVRALNPQLDLEGAAALAFTSANAVRAFAALCADRRTPVFAVGGATAEAAVEAGFVQVTSADGDVRALGALIAQRAGELGGPVLHPAAREPSSPLLAPGVVVRAVAVYEAAPLPIEAGLIERLDAVMIHSRRAAVLVAAQPGAARLVAYCLSAQAAGPLIDAGFKAVRVAAAPSEAALLALTDDPEPPPVLNRTVWLLLAFGLACILGGLAVAYLAPR